MKIFRHCFPLLLLIFSIIPLAHAQERAALPEKFPVPFGPTNMGREFWLAFPANWELPGATSYYIRLYITSNVRTSVTVWAGKSVAKVVYTIPNDIVSVDLTPMQAQMLVRDDNDPVPPDSIYRKKAIRVVSKDPIAVYGMNRTTYTSDGLLALPTNALGREYIVASYAATHGPAQELPSQYMIIAPYNGTTVTITHPDRTPNHQPDQTFTINLDSGDVWSAMTLGSGSDMSGAVIRSNKPVAVTAGHPCAYVPAQLNFCCCDHISEMMLPTSSWGTVYHGVPLQTRLKGDFYRIFARERNTKVYVNGVLLATLDSAGGHEGQGWVEYRALTKDPVDFTADKPIFVTQYNTSQFYDNVPSDPFYQVLTPMEQYQTSFMFATPAADFPQNFLNLVCDSAGFYKMEITPAGKNEWKPVWNLSGAGVPKKFTSRPGGKTYLGVVVEIKPGIYNMRGTSPFGGNIYGFSSFDSYGYPIGIATEDLTKADKAPPTVRKTQGCDGTVEVTVTDQPDDDASRTNLASIDLDPVNSSNYDLLMLHFEAGITRQTTFRLRVTDKTRPARAIVIISDMAGNITYDTVVYNPLNVTLLPSPRDFGKVRVGEKAVQTVILTNESEEPAEINEVLLKSGAEGFQILSPKGKIVLGPKGSPSASVAVQIEFTAAVRGSNILQMFEDSVGVRDTCGLHYQALVKAQVVKPMILVTDHDFGTSPVGKATATWEMEVSNPSTIEGSALIVTARTGPNQPQIFDVLGGTALQFPFELEPGQSRTLQIRFTPVAAREYRDTIFFTSNAMDVAAGGDFGWLAGTGIPDTTSSVAREETGIAINSVEITPNPVERDEAMLRYVLARSGAVSVVIVDAAGRELRVVEKDGVQEAGMQSVRLDLKELPAGVYFVRVMMGGESLSRPLVIVR